jgi:hypothetical protein
LITSGATISVFPTAWRTAGARLLRTSSSTRAEASITIGIVGPGPAHAQGGVNLGFSLGPGGVERLHDVVRAKVDRLPGST